MGRNLETRICQQEHRAYDHLSLLIRRRVVPPFQTGLVARPRKESTAKSRYSLKTAIDRKAARADAVTQVWDPTQRLAGMIRDAARVTEQRLRVLTTWTLDGAWGNSSRPIGGLGADCCVPGAGCLGVVLYGANTKGPNRPMDDPTAIILIGNVLLYLSFLHSGHKANRQLGFCLPEQESWWHRGRGTSFPAAEAHNCKFPIADRQPLLGTTGTLVPIEMPGHTISSLDRN
ncbi:MAG: hypothetical protein Q9186_004444 [Xanthomendoza sp. 1 TL-2023]